MLEFYLCHRSKLKESYRTSSPRHQLPQLPSSRPHYTHKKTRKRSGLKVVANKHAKASRDSDRVGNSKITRFACGKGVLSPSADVHTSDTCANALLFVMSTAVLVLLLFVLFFALFSLPRLITLYFNIVALFGPQSFLVAALEMTQSMQLVFHDRTPTKRTRSSTSPSSSPSSSSVPGVAFPKECRVAHYHRLFQHLYNFVAPTLARMPSVITSRSSQTKGLLETEWIQR